MAKSRSGLTTRRKRAGDRRVAKVLRQVRIDAGLTQRALAERMKRPQSSVWNYEKARRRVNVAEFIGWCKACGVDPMSGFDAVLELMS